MAWIVGADLTGVCPNGVKTHKAGSVPMNQALHNRTRLASLLAVSIASHNETILGAL
jgi:hypothetical protein